MIEEFNKYTSNYDMKIAEIKRKYNHSIRVMNLAKKYAKILGFKENDIELATVIGLLHDIGRFEQFKKYHTFDDFTSINHAEYGAKLLMQDNLIKKFYQTSNEEDYKIIEFAIRNHNKLKIETTSNNKKYIKHAKLIRDVDKIDLIFISAILKETKYKVSSEDLNKNVINSIQNHTPVDKKDIKNINDKIALRFGFAFDINYKVCLKELKKYLVEFYKTIEDKDSKIKTIYEEVMKYIDSK